ncbi:MAG: radical SAM family heme chaperone HemW [Bacteroidales bacterium]
MAGIYLHIPFCHQKCHYCNFFSTASKKHKNAFVNALLIEIELQKSYLKQEEISTIYFGGGTPSLLETKEIQHIIDNLFLNYTVLPNAEITLEANPEDLTIEKLKALSHTQVNRLSIGIQSFQDNDLQYLNRSHSSQQAKDAIKNAQMHGFSNLSIDLIYGIPGLTNDVWIENIEIAIQSGVSHISAYCLTVEAGTALDIFIKKGKMPAVDEEKSSQQFEILMKFLSENNYIHYEISNFCKEGFISLHNSNYWKQQKYLGLGPSAHSFNLHSRQWNVSNLTKYIQVININSIPCEIETLSLKQQYDEYILTGLRTIWGINEKEIHSKYGEEIFNYFKKEVEKYLQKGWVIRMENIYYLSNEGKYFADGIASDLFFE